jgi:hypothetical protein
MFICIVLFSFLFIALVLATKGINIFEVIPDLFDEDNKNN